MSVIVSALVISSLLNSRFECLCITDRWLHFSYSVTCTLRYLWISGLGERLTSELILAQDYWCHNSSFLADNHVSRSTTARNFDVLCTTRLTEWYIAHIWLRDTSQILQRKGNICKLWRQGLMQPEIGCILCELCRKIMICQPWTGNLQLCLWSTVFPFGLAKLLMFRYLCVWSRLHPMTSEVASWTCTYVQSKNWF